MSNIYLSKSKYCKCVQCPKILWLKTYKPEVAIPSEKDAVFENGRRVGELAKGIFGKYEDIEGIVEKNEPHIALYADNDGLYYYEEILKNCKKNLKDNFIIAFEIGKSQGKLVKNLALKYLDNIDVFIKKDLNNLDRFVIIVSKMC